MNGTDKMLSVIGPSYFHPIAWLVEKLLTMPSGTPSELKAHDYENGYAAGICVLSVVSFESWAMRIRYLNAKHAAASQKTAVNFLSTLYPTLPDVDELWEVVVLRDLLVHNHLWEIDFAWDDSYALSVSAATKSTMSGDAKYLLHVDAASRVTRRLRLHVVPTSVDRTDARLALQSIWKTLLFLESQDRSQCFVSHYPLQFRGKKAYFQEVVESL